MLARVGNFLRDGRDRQRMTVALAKGAATMNARRIDLTRPATWEFSGFSQNGEDGILDVLRGQLRAHNRYVVEVGAADGLENNSAWLVVAEKYSGLLVDGDPALVARARRMIMPQSIGVECRRMFVTREAAPELRALAWFPDPDVFSLDIDGMDYHVAEAVLAAGFRPKVFVVEFNAVFGPERSVTVEYRPDFVFTTAHPSALWYGVSITAWRRFFARHGYRFVTVDQNGVNAFFADPACFDAAFLDGVRGLEFAENRYQWRKFGAPSAEQFKRISDQKLLPVE
jgi:hypothetical protein